MAGSLRKYTVQEADNAALGQAGSIYIDADVNTGDAECANSSTCFVAITIISDARFDTLTPEDGDGKQYPGTGAASDAGKTAGNVAISSGGSGREFPSGVTIYGRWKKINLAQGAAIAYIG